MLKNLDLNLSSNSRCGNNNMNFRLACDRVVLPKTAPNLRASWSKANDFFAVFSSFELGGITKHLITGPAGNIEFCFPSTSMFPSALGVWGNKTDCFPRGQSLSAYFTILLKTNTPQAAYDLINWCKFRRKRCRRSLQRALQVDSYCSL